MDQAEMLHDWGLECCYLNLGGIKLIVEKDRQSNIPEKLPSEGHSSFGPVTKNVSMEITSRT
jgi:hypothetical protein